MKVIEETIGNTTILIQTMDDTLEIMGKDESGRATHLTGIEDEVQDTYTKVKTVVKNIAEDIGAELDSISTIVRPQQVEMEFNIGISAQVGAIWIVSGKGEYALKVKMIWELDSYEQID